MEGFEDFSDCVISSEELETLKAQHKADLEGKYSTTEVVVVAGVTATAVAVAGLGIAFLFGE